MKIKNDLATLLICIMIIININVSNGSLPKNGTFVFTRFNDENCRTVTSSSGYAPEAKLWSNPIQGLTFSPISYDNQTSVLNYKECTSVPVSNDCTGNNKSLTIDNSCQNINNGFYTINFIPISNLSIFTFTGYSDGGCNNVNGESYPLKTTNYCWTLKGSGSMSLIKLDDRTLVVNKFATDDCLGVRTENKIKCNEKCIVNPLNNEDIHYTCKYTSSGYVWIKIYYMILLLSLF